MVSNNSISNLYFEQLFYKWNSKVYNYALKKTNSTYIAEETVQRVFIKLWNNISSKEIDIHIEAQIFCITRSILLDVVRAENSKKQAVENFKDNRISITPSDVLLTKELYINVLKIIKSMPPVRKKVFELSRFENLKYAEIAQKLNISVKTVENHIALALKTLKKSILIFLFIFSLLY